MNDNRSKLMLLFTCVVFGTLGTITRYIELPSSMLCFARAALGVVTIIAYFMLTRKPVDFKAIRSNLPKLALLGGIMSANWICQFEAFKHTTIAISTVCYYTQPIFLIIGAAIFFRERLSAKKVICIIVAFAGMVLVSGVLQGGIRPEELVGVAFAIVGAIGYAAVILLNKTLSGISPFDTTMTQLFFAAVLVVPYVLMTEDVSAVAVSTTGLICILIVGVLHTGICYVIYFASVQKLNAQTVGIISYVDPVLAVLLSAFFLKEPITIAVIAGAVMILGATAVSELTGNK